MDATRIQSQIFRGAGVASVLIGAVAFVLGAACAFGSAPVGITAYAAAVAIYAAALICGIAGAAATGTAKRYALLRFGRGADGRSPRWGQVVSPCPRWVRWTFRAALAVMLAYAALIWLQTWRNAGSMNAEKIAALFSAFAAAVACNGAVAFFAAAGWLTARQQPDILYDDRST